MVRKLRVMSEALRVNKLTEDKKLRRWEVKLSVSASQRLSFLLLLFTIHCSLFTAAYAAGGDIIWQFGDAKAGKQEAKAAAIDSAGNIIITGFSNQSGSEDFYTAKIKADGTTVLWSKTFDKAGGNDKAVAAAVDSFDNIVVTGYVWNGVNYDFHTIKYQGSDGTVLWQHTFNSAINGNDYAVSIAVDSLNNIYIGGNSQGGNGADDCMIVKYVSAGPNPDGTPIWQKSYNGPANGHDRITSITAGADGVAVTGESQNSVPDFDMLTVKYGLDSSFIWEKRKSASGDDKGEAVQMDLSGNVVSTGYTYNGSNRDIYIAKYNSSTSDVEWENNYDGGYNEEPSRIWMDAAGDFYITGHSFTIDGADDFFTARYRGSDGIKLWSHTFNSENGNIDRATGIVGDDAGDLFVTGDTYNAGTGEYDLQTLKYARASGALLWHKNFNGPAGKDDRAAGIGVAASGEVIVAGWSDAWTAGASDYDYYAVKYDAGLLNAPTGLVAATVSSSEISLSWDDNSSNEDGFAIERKIGNLGAFEQINTVGAGVTIYNDTPLSADVKYFYRVRSYNSTQGNSHFSNTAYAVTTIFTFSTPSQVYAFAGEDAGDDYVSALAAGPDNNPVVTGYSFSLAGQFDYLTAKISRQNMTGLWSVRYDSDQNDTDVAKTIIVDDTNSVLVSGYSNLYSQQSGANTNDIYTIKYPSSGSAELWHDQYNGPAGDDDRSSVVDVSTDGNDNYVVVGYGRNVNWDDDIYVIKYSSDGTRLWAAVPYNGGGNDYPAAVAFDSAGDIIVAGYTYNGANYDYLTRKYNGTNGAVIWTDIYGGIGSGNDFARALALDSSGNAYVTGVVVTSSGNEDFHTMKYSGANGARLWGDGNNGMSFNGVANGIDEAIGIKVDPVNGDIVVAGTTLAGEDNNELHVIRYQPDGPVAWQRTVNGPLTNEFAVAMAIDLSGNVHLTGDTINASGTDIISVQYDVDGTFLGGMTYNGSAGAIDSAAAITVNKLGEAFVGGHTTNAEGNSDYVVFKVTNGLLQTPSPLIADGLYEDITLTWSDNSLDEDGFYIERKVGLCSSSDPWNLVHTALANENTYIDDMLGFGAEYCYRVSAFRNDGQSSPWVEAGGVTRTPECPTGLSATTANSTTINLSWTDNTTGEEGSRIERCAGDGCSDFTGLTSTAANAVTYPDTSVCNSTKYSYRIKAFKTAHWNTCYTNVASATTSPGTAPTGLNAARISETQINLAWTDNTSDETGFVLEKCSSGNCSEITLTAASYNDTDLQSGVVYTYRVKAFKTAGCSWSSDWSNTATQTTTINAPTSFNATASGTTTVNLSWTDNTISETGFTIERCAGTGCDFSTKNEFSVAANILNYSDTSACEGTVYKYRIKAIKTGQWEGPYSAEKSVTVTGKITPAGFTATAVSESQINLSWTDTNADETGFEVQRCTGAAAACVEDADFTFAKTVTGAVTYQDKNLLAGTIYTYRVRAFKTATCNWQTAFSNTDSEATITPPPPSGLSAAAANTTQVNLAWTDNTGSETNFKVERCSGTGCSDFSEIGTANANTAAYQDTSVCRQSNYTYRVKAANEGLSSSSGGCWTRRAPLTISNFQADFQTKFVVTYDPDMQPDFDDIRFYDTAASRQLPYWIESKTDGVSATVWVKTGTGNSVSMYYGNASATSASSAASSFEFYDAFDGNAIDTSKWTITNSTGFTVSDGYLHGTNNTGRLTSKTAHSSGVILVIKARTSTIAPNGQMIGGFYISTSNSIGIINYPGSTYYRNDSTWVATVGQQPSNNLLYTITSMNSSTVNLKIYNLDTSTVFWDSGTLTNTVSGEPIVLGQRYDNGYTGQTYATDWDYVYVRKYAATEPSVATGSEENSACFIFDNLWQSAYSGTASATTTTPVAPVLTATRGTEVQANLSWTDGNPDETGFSIERCTGAGCTDFTEVGTAGPNVTTYNDAGLNINTSYRYRVKVFKTAACSWELTSNIGDVTTNIAAPGNPAAVVSNTTQINISWTDTAGTETGIRLQRCEGTACDFSTVTEFTLVPDTDDYTDTSVCKSTSYSYRVRSEKTDGPVWDSSWSATVSAATQTPGAQSGLTATRSSEIRIDLSWTDNTADENGFIIERCAGAGCSDFAELTTVGANINSYIDQALMPAISYSYRVRAYKTALCGWETGHSNTSSVLASISTPSGLSATAINTTQIDLAWSDNTTSESNFVIERCSGEGCSGFTQIGSTASNVTAYSDTSACNNSSYTYRVKAAKIADLSNSGGGCWTRRSTLSIANFTGNYATAVTIPYDANMQADFDDIRFYDETAQVELQYWIDSKTNGSSVTAYFRTLGNNNISLYYGNPVATNSSNVSGMFEFYYDFPGTTIDTSKWVEIDPDNSFTQNNGLILNDVSDSWSKALISQQTFSRSANREFVARISISDSPGNNHFMAGWELNQTTDPNYTQLVHGFYWNNFGSLTTYEKGSGTGGISSVYVLNTTYDMKVVLKAVGAKYYIKGGSFTNWTLVKETSTHSDALMRLAFVQHSHQATIQHIRVNTAASTEPVISLGAEQQSACYAFTNAWSSGHSNNASAVTPAMTAPTGFSATAVTDTQADLTWTDTNADESGFRIERCQGEGCSDFAEIASVNANIAAYSDAGLDPSVTYCYRVKAYKTASCSWASDYISSCDLLFSAKPTGLTATALNSMMVRLDWTDNSGDESGYEIEMKVWNGFFTKVADVAADVTAYTDTTGIEEQKEYIYRVRTIRGSDKSPYSNEAAVITPVYQSTDVTCE